jgi:hypothetical protein
MRPAAITDLSIVQRLGWFLLVALFDELFYRFMLMSAAFWLLRALPPRYRIAAAWAVIVGIAFVVYPAVASDFISRHCQRAP